MALFKNTTLAHNRNVLFVCPSGVVFSLILWSYIKMIDNFGVLDPEWKTWFDNRVVTVW